MTTFIKKPTEVTTCIICKDTNPYIEEKNYICRTCRVRKERWSGDNEDIKSMLKDQVDSTTCYCNSCNSIRSFNDKISEKINGK